MYIHTRVYIIIIKTKYNWDLLYTSIKNFVICACAHRVLYHISCKLFFSHISVIFISFLYFAYLSLSLRSASIHFVRADSQPLASLLMRYNYDFSRAEIWRGYNIFSRRTLSLRILFYEHILRCANVHCMSQWMKTLHAASPEKEENPRHTET